MSLDEMRKARNRRLDAERRKRNALAQLRGEPTGFIDAAPVRAKILALENLGWSTEAISHAAGVGSREGIRLLAHGTSRKAERKFQAVANLPLTLAVPDSVPDTCLVPMLGATRRIRALMTLGWRHEDISATIGRASHHIAAGRYPKMPALDWRVVDAAYSRMSAVDGGSSRTRIRARKAGFIAPLGWEDIDDPRETPAPIVSGELSVDPVVVMRLLEGRRIQSTPAEKRAAMEQWVRDGGTRAELARVHGWKEGRYSTGLRVVQGGAA